MIYSNNSSCFNYLCSKIDINNIKFNLAEGVKLINNYYEQIKYDEIDYSLDGNYLKLGKKLLIKDNYYEYKRRVKVFTL